MKRVILAALAVMAIVVTSEPVSAATIDQAYHHALKDFYAGHYKEAVNGLERIVALPLHNEELFYNLGCAYFRLGDLGRAIYNYERALALDPSFGDARYNLELARRLAASKVKDVIKGSDKADWWTKTVKLLGLQGWWAVVLVLWWLMLGILLLLRRIGHGPARAGLVAANSFIVLLLVGAVLPLTARIRMATDSREAIVLPEQLTAREGPDADAKSSFKLHAGLRVRLEGGSSGWVRVRLPNGLEGWVQQRQVGVL